MAVPDPPIEPPPSPWNLNRGVLDDDSDLVGAGADLQPGTLLAAYRLGLFPMGLGADGALPIGWWCPVDRGVLPPARFHVSRSMRRSLRGFTIRVDHAFEEVVERCATTRADGNWITAEIAAAYAELHRLGWAHSVETWAQGRLVGGLYGVAIGGLFAGESMFHDVTDASKAALGGLAALMADGEPRRLIDVQWQTPHLASLGVIQIPRADYLAALPDLLGGPALRWSRLAADGVCLR